MTVRILTKQNRFYYLPQFNPLGKLNDIMSMEVVTYKMIETY